MVVVVLDGGGVAGHTAITTVLPALSELPPDGVWLTTRPALPVVQPDDAAAAETVRPWPWRVAVALPWVRPITFWTITWHDPEETTNEIAVCGATWAPPLGLEDTTRPLL